MSQIIELLNEKNNYLEKFFKINEAELIHLSENNFENLDNFYTARDCMLNMIKSVDKRIEDLNRGLLTPEIHSDNQKKVILRELDRKNEWVQEILVLDLQILSAIEEEKSRVIKELRKTSVTKKAVGSYKSGTHNKDKSYNESV